MQHSLGLYLVAQGVNGEVTFYASVNDANNNGQFSGDIIRPYELKINPAATTSITASALEESTFDSYSWQIRFNLMQTIPCLIQYSTPTQYKWSAKYS